jgi:hypothetical protein
MEGSDTVALAAAQKVCALWKRVGTVFVLVEPIRQLGCNGSHGADRVCRGLKVAHVKAVKHVISHREVDGGRLVGVDMHRVIVGVLLGWHGPTVLHGKHLENQVGRRNTGRRRRR